MNAPVHLPALIDALPHQSSAAPEGGFTRARQSAFLHALADCGTVRRAAAAAGISYRTAYRERRASAAFARAWDAALLSARALGEDVLATRALDGVEEAVYYRGELIATRRRYDSRLLLAHLARLDKLTEDARTRAFADDFAGAMERFAAGEDDPAPVCPDCGEPLPIVECPDTNPGKGRTFTPGQCDKCDMPSVKAAEARAERRARERAKLPCAECGGRCNDPDAVLGPGECRYDEDARYEAMYEARPDDAPLPDEYPGHVAEAVEAAQLAAFEAGIDRWWLAVPPAAGDDPDEWCFAEG